MRPLVSLSDPVRSHGAWVTLFVATAVGVLSQPSAPAVRGLIVGAAFAGGFLVVSALAVGARKLVTRLAKGLSLSAVALTLGPLCGVDPRWLWALLAAAVLGLAALVCARRVGVLSPLTLCLSLAPLTLSSAAIALANRASVLEAASLFLALWSFSCWRSLTVARSLRSSESNSRSALRARGLREAAYAALWGGCVTLAGVGL